MSDKTNKEDTTRNTSSAHENNAAQEASKIDTKEKLAAYVIRKPENLIKIIIVITFAIALILFVKSGWECGSFKKTPATIPGENK